MLELWTTYGFYLWALTTALVIVALAWLAWSTFSAQGETGGSPTVDPAAVDALNERVTTLIEAIPHMQATLGRAFQFCGLVRYTDVSGAQAFSLAIASARGDGFVLSSSVRGGLNSKPLSHWTSSQSLSREEQAAIDQARDQYEKP